MNNFQLIVNEVKKAVNGKAMLCAGAKPYLSVKCKEGVSSLDMLKKIFKV